jgi:ParB family chromosome partitioning protein
VRWKEQPGYDRLLADLVTHYRASFGPNVWRATKYLLCDIPDAILERACAMVADQGTTDPDEPEDRLKAELAADSLDALKRAGYCETRMADGREEFRLTKSNVPISAGRDTSPTPLATEVAIGVDTARADADDAVTETTAPPSDEHKPQTTPVIRTADGDYQEKFLLVPVQDIREHPLLDKIPVMAPEDRAALEKDIRVRGVMDPVTLQEKGIPAAGQYLLLDGRHRHRAATVAGLAIIPARIVNLTEEQQVDQIYGSALLRRNLTDDQRAVVASHWIAEQAARSRKERASKAGRAGGRGRAKRRDSSRDDASPELSTPPDVNTASQPVLGQASRQFKVSQRKLKTARRLEQSAPDLLDEVRTGAKTLPQASREARQRESANSTSGWNEPKRPGRELPRRSQPTQTEPTPHADPGDAALTVKLRQKSPRALLDALVTAIGMDDALTLLREAIALGEAARQPAPVDASVPEQPLDPAAMEGVNQSRSA